ncbi:MAG: hypothetical protein KKC68_02690, partial [Candidatus Thermoplasmatota archaeon]|nr:hypothetical protein [Candidatus Thermoplasmatota archaeon]
NDSECVLGRDGSGNDIFAPLDEYGVEKATGCCVQRPRVIVKKGSYLDYLPHKKNVDDTTDVNFPRPGINAGVDSNTLNPLNFQKLCRNGMIIAKYNQIMDLDTLEDQFVVEYNNKTLACPQSNAQVSIWGKIVNTIKGFWGRIVFAEDIWCSVDGMVEAINVGENSQVMFTPSMLLEPSLFDKSNKVYRDYRVTLKGGNIEGDAVKNVKGGSVTANGVSMYQDFYWSFLVMDKICEIHSVEVEVEQKDLIRLIDKDIKEDQYFCGGNRNNCADDVYSNINKNQHRYIPYAKDKDGGDLVATFAWTKKDTPDNTTLKNDPNSVLSQCQKKSVCLCQNEENPSQDCIIAKSQVVCSEDDQSKLDVSGVSISSPLNNGTSQMTVFATGCYVGSGSGTKSVPSRVFLCENPWPAIGSDKIWRVWKDTSTNFSFYYCRDAGAPGTDDDLPAISNNIADVPIVGESDNIVRDSDGTCPTLADFKCGEDGKTYLNQCVIDKTGVYVQKEGRCGTGIIKELLFFVDVPDGIIRDAKNAEEAKCLTDFPADYVCVDDGNTYYNKCFVEKRGLNVAYLGKCESVD